MKRNLNARFYQRYFEVIKRNASKNHADWLSWVPVQYRLDILSRLTQWDIDSVDEKEYRQRL
ncbi:glucose uptake inhibitor SgrT [Rahnella bruchi]|uniref:glucose uptake inhibitor SgrT n=1 Tax=Rahnella bruchi TaxID=1510573 RepID=UPI000EA18A58|nr:glucose uptake inhibitor SgrT [Rahnella bruchi]